MFAGYSRQTTNRPRHVRYPAYWCFMDVTAEDFRRHYELLSDEALLEVDPGELVQLARDCHAEEVARRGLTDAPEVETTGDAAGQPEAAVAAEDELICIVEYDYMDEADLARGLLEASEITASLESEPGVVRLMVPPASAEQALRLLAAPLSDEELAAQAEAAGFEADSELEGDEEPEELNPPIR